MVEMGNIAVKLRLKPSGEISYFLNYVKQIKGVPQGCEYVIKVDPDPDPDPQAKLLYVVYIIQRNMGV